ncbi:MAG: tetratricopeptide repeat protein [Betaproteobacteria bacterium]|nr:tetratricopeptide repeat protein [Betaproteobacteria bacterium]
MEDSSLFGWLRRRRERVPASRFSETQRTALEARAEDAVRAGDLVAASEALGPLLGDTVVHAHASHLAGIVAFRSGDFAAADTHLVTATATDPAREASWRALVEVREALDRPAAAVEAVRGLLALVPGDADALSGLVRALAAAGRHDEAIEACRMHRLLDWQFDTDRNPAAVLHAQGRLRDAVDLLRNRIAADRANPSLWGYLGCTRQAQAHLDTAIACFREAVTLDAGSPVARRRLARALAAVGELDAALEHHDAAVALVPDDPRAHSDLFAARLYAGWPSREAREAAHRRYDERFGAARFAPESVARPASADGRIRVGYVSGDFREHALMHFLEPVLARHDRGRFEVWCYDRTGQRDAVTARLETMADQWRRVRGDSWDELARRIQDDRIDILVDLKGHFDDSHLPLFARRPAPVQVTWLGYPGTTGLSAVDACLTDDHVAADLRDDYASEAIVSLGPVFACFRPLDCASRPGPLPMAGRGHPTFGCFNDFAKVSPAMREAIAEILRRVPEAHCLVTTVPDGNTRRHLEAFFAERGIDPARVEIRGRGRHDEFLRWHDEIDVSLDSFPCNGRTTTLHSLWMGVPVVTLAGHTHASRVGASILLNLDLADWMAHDVEEYVGIAVRAVTDTRALAALRADLRHRLAVSPIMDETRFSRRLERCYDRLLRAHALSEATEVQEC